ncbi:MAG: hypothetical protein HYU66_00290 [Armatimonadetes bacterium]|nr:hypothetical protein [Armatimonadota bacterium]
MKSCHDLSALPWTVSGWTPELWRLVRTMEIGVTPDAEVAPIPAPVPGSVQQALRDAGLLPDWNVGLDARLCEWVENRHWIYETDLPDDWLQPGCTHRLVCLGLDYCGSVWLNGHEVGGFVGTHRPHAFDLTEHLAESGNRLRIAFDLPPRWLGQFGWTSRVKEWKARFNYTWDWIPRLVQVGIWDAIALEVSDGRELGALSVRTGVDAGGGWLAIRGEVAAGEGDRVAIRMTSVGSDGAAGEPGLVWAGRPRPAPTASAGGRPTGEGAGPTAVSVGPAELASGLRLNHLPVDRWWPNLEGEQPLYRLTVSLTDSLGTEHDRIDRRVGFRAIDWSTTEGAPEGADPWLCSVNGRPVFLQGANFPPILPNFADCTREHYRTRIETYRDLGANCLRVNGCGFLERDWFYDLCDELGILVWQDAPLSSSGIDNYPPEDPQCIADQAAIFEQYIARRGHHACLLLWCGGNELLRVDETGRTVPCDLSHPLLKRQSEVVAEHDPGRRFLPTTPQGPRTWASKEEFGQGLHWDVHGPWKPWDDLTEWAAFFAADDALFRAETGSPGTCSAELIRRYAGDLPVLPVSPESDLWRRGSTWWIEAAQFEAEHGTPPETLEAYVAWSQARQARALSLVVGACKDRFPRCGGILLWCGHDCFPCAANTSILDFEGNPKPAALALREIWRRAAR